MEYTISTYFNLDPHSSVGKRGVQRIELRIYFNNHYGGKAVVNAMQSEEMIGLLLSEDERRVRENTKAHVLGN